MPRNKALMKKRAGGAPKKIVIKPFSKPPTLPANYYETTSRELLEGTMSVTFDPEAAKSSNLSLQNSYQQVVNLVSHQYGPRLYQDLIQTLRKACAVYVLPKDDLSVSVGGGNAVGDNNSNLLSYIQTQYQKYVDYLLLCKHVFLPLDRTHAWTLDGNAIKRTAGEGNASSGGAPSSLGGSLGLWQVGLEQFRLRLNEFQLHDLIYQKWWESLQLDYAKNLPLDQQPLLSSTLYMWQDLAILAPTLSQKLEPDLIQFFQADSEALKSEKYTAKAVINHCQLKWNRVSYNWNRFLPKVICVNLLENHLFKPHLHPDWLLHPANFDPLIEEAIGSRSLVFSNLWDLSGRVVGGYKAVGSSIARYAKARGYSLTKSMNDPKVARSKIAELLQLQGQLQELLFPLAHAMEYCSLKNVWEDVVNPPVDNGNNIVAEALAKYVDSYLRDSKKDSKKIEGETKWAESIISGIFCYLEAKDVFEAFYKQNLAKRLLHNKVQNGDVERHFVSLLKAECGAGYTAKMEGMFQDIEWSKNTMTPYKQTLFAEGPTKRDEVDVDIQVLTTGYWPLYPQFPNLILPDALKRKQEHFTNYYKSKYQGRRMTWQYALGNCIVEFRTVDAKGSKSKYDLVVSPCQALVLLQFNDDEDKKLPQLMTAVGLDDRAEMERILHSLSVGKDGTRVIQKRDHDGDKKKKPRTAVHDDDIFRPQPYFVSKTRRIRISNIQAKETKEEREKTVEAVSRDRLYLIDAVLVRIMKARKTILHQQLIPQVLEQVKVPAQPGDVKKRIESLIEREYMERDSDDRTRYNYLA